jgi:hypothetical protein
MHAFIHKENRQTGKSRDAVTNRGDLCGLFPVQNRCENDEGEQDQRQDCGLRNRQTFQRVDRWENGHAAA